MNYINTRVLNEAQVMMETGYTIREIAKMFHVSKSTVHKDLHERLLKIDKIKFEKVDKILKFHTDVRHIRGGKSTKRKYMEQKK